MNPKLKIIAEQIHNFLISLSDEQVKNSSQRYFKEKINVLGVKAPDVKKISRHFRNEIKFFSKNEIFQLCELLWLSGYLEESFLACDLSFCISKSYKKEDIETFEKWIKNYVNNWASCDTFCNHNVGTILEMHEDLTDRLYIWAKSRNRWLKRASAVSLIVPAKKGKFLKEILQIADILLLDSDDMVQKGYGWMLKSASNSNQNEIFQYVMVNKKLMPRTALRYAIEKLPENLKKKAMEK